MFISPQRKLLTKTCVLCSSYFKQYNLARAKKISSPAVLSLRGVAACTCCRVAKAKCEDGPPCRRCQRLGLHCVGPVPRRKRPTAACSVCQLRKERCVHVRRERPLRFSWSVLCLSLPLDLPAMGLFDYEPVEFAALLRESEQAKSL